MSTVINMHVATGWTVVNCAVASTSCISEATSVIR